MKNQAMKYPFLFDGAMGTYYREIQKNPLPECEMANLFDPETIVSIHRAYIKSGAKAIKSNTFSANLQSLHCNKNILKNIINEGIRLGLEAIGSSNVLLFADIGPIPEKNGKNRLEDYLFIVDLFLQKNIRYFLFETFSNTKYLEEIAHYIKEKEPKSFIITSFAIQPDGSSREGFFGNDLLAAMEKCPDIDGLGFNCICGPYHLLEYLKTIEKPSKPLSIMPNAGYPSIVNNRTYFNSNPGYFAHIAVDFLHQGVQILGGCCGTTPQYIEKIAEQLEEMTSTPIALPIKKTPQRIHATGSLNLFAQKVLSAHNHRSPLKTTDSFTPRDISSQLQSTITTPGKKVIAVEYDPPKHMDIQLYMENIKKLKHSGIDALTIADCPIGRARIDSSLMAVKIKRETGLEPIVHFTCRDRNLNATKALLMGLNMENILNLIVVTGDPIPTAERDEIKAVFNFNSQLLTQYITTLNADLFHREMQVGVALNINSKNFPAELRKAQKKEECGASIFFTQPVLSKKAIENLYLASETLDSPIMGGIIPIISHRNALFMNAEISGITIDESIINQYENNTKEDAEKLAVNISLSFMEEIASLVVGYYLITPFNRVDIITKITEKLMI